MPVPASQIVTDALTEIRYARAGDVLSAEDMAFGFSKLLRLIDLLNADATTPFTSVFTAYTPIALHQPHTLGPTGDWSIAQRPLVIKHANLILPATGASGPIRIPIEIRDDDWWATNRVRGVATAIPTSLYYSPDWPNGSVYLWPVPTTTNQIELQTDVLIGAMVLTTSFSMPYGYQDFITLRLAVECAPAFGQSISPDTHASLKRAELTVLNRNLHATNANTRDGGMPGGSSLRGRFNYLTGEVE